MLFAILIWILLTALSWIFTCGIIKCKVLHREYELRLPAVKPYVDQQPDELLREA